VRNPRQSPALDAVDPARSAMMSRIRSRDTRPELVVRSIVHRLGYRFRLHQTDLPGQPDIVLTRLHTIILVHGCFWHRHSRCRFAYMPKSRVDFWVSKFKKNVARDRKVRQALRRQGWQVLVIWECETKNLARLTERLRKLLQAADDTA